MSDSDRRQGRTSGHGVHDLLTRLMSIAMLAIGVALAARGTLLALVLGLLFLVAGGGRLYVQIRSVGPIQPSGRRRGPR